MAFDVREYWNFNDPAGSEETFRLILKQKDFSHDEKLEIWAQIARTYSLRSRCDQCHEILDEYWDDAMIAGGRPKACFELEKGRAYRSGGDPQASIPHFQAAAQSEAEDLKVDALHMLALVAGGDEGVRINLDALEIARVSENPFAQRWQGTLCNNLGWSSFDAQDYAKAIEWFRLALEQREKYGDPENIRVAKWCLARAFRANGELDAALAIQTEIVEQGAKGYAYEEMGEILLAQGKPEEAKPYFRQAVKQLESELGPDSERIQRMRGLS